MATAREALTSRIRTLNEQIQRLAAKAQALRNQRDQLVLDREALTDGEAAKIDSLQQQGVVRVED